MLTSDVSLTKDPKYAPIVAAWAKDAAAFDFAFKHAWYKLTTRDMGPATRCAGKDTPPPQPFQFPLPPPPPPSALAPVAAVRAAIADAVASGSRTAATLLPTLAWQCASTFRLTDYQGGCNGARLRFAPQRDWPANAGLGAALALLEPVKRRFGARLSWADLIVLAGTDALAPGLPFCAGRTDATDGEGSHYLLGSSTRLSPASTQPALLYEFAKVAGLTARQMVALLGAAIATTGFGAAAGAAASATAAAAGAAQERDAAESPLYFTALMTERWEPTGDAATPCTASLFGSRTLAPDGAPLQCRRYKAVGKELYLFESDLLVKWDAPLYSIAMDFAASPALYRAEYRAAWTKLMNADRFDGPASNLCDTPAAAQVEAEEVA